MKKGILCLSIFFLIFIVACSADETTPQERFDTYVKQWNDQNFDKMYDMLATESKDGIATEAFADRYQKIYEDLDITDLNISYETPSDEELKTAMDKGTATLPFTVEMESMAGPITFDYEATLIQEGEKDEKNWFLAWDQGFIFPAMKDGGEINVETEEPRRGEILDRNKMPLAINDMVYEIGIVPEKLGENAEQTKKKIADLLNISVDSIDNALDADWVEPDLSVPDRKSTRLNSSHVAISYAVFCLKKKKYNTNNLDKSDLENMLGVENDRGYVRYIYDRYVFIVVDRDLYECPDISKSIFALSKCVR